jgi:methylenetetrahydrofolate reductase (NADPH)
MKIALKLKKKKTFSLEFFPPKNEEEFEIFIKTIKELKKYKPDFVSVTDSNISAKLKHIALSKLIKEKIKVDVLVHLTCINNTKNEIKNIINVLEENKIENILALRGDPRNFYKNLNEFKHTTDLLKIIPKEKFSIGVAIHPEGNQSKDIKKEIKYLKIKKDLGANFGITQVFFDNSKFYDFINIFEKNSIKLPIICGILPITSYKIYEKIREKVKNLTFPKELINIIEKYKDKKEELVESTTDFAAKQIEELKKYPIAGFHFFTFNRAYGVRKILSKTNIL